MNPATAPSPQRPGIGPAPAASDAPGGRGLLARVLGALVGLSVRLGVAAHRASKRAAGAGDEAPPVDLPRVWALLIRAEKWMAALRARLNSAAAAKPRADDRDEWRRELDSELRLETDPPDVDPRIVSRLTPYGGKARRDPTAGLTDQAVVEHICADLAEVARLLGEPDLAAAAAAIAQVARQGQAHPTAPAPHRGAPPPPAAHPPPPPDTG
jgi:hypothetical protein